MQIYSMKVRIKQADLEGKSVEEMIEIIYEEAVMNVMMRKKKK